MMGGWELEMIRLGCCFRFGEVDEAGQQIKKRDAGSLPGVSCDSHHSLSTAITGDDITWMDVHRLC